MSSIACISVRQPWASLIVHGIKDFENRDWPCAHRGPLLIHASKTWTRDEKADFAELLRIASNMRDMRRYDILIASQELKGGIIGVVDMDDCIHKSDWRAAGNRFYDGRHNWFCGLWGWHFTNARVFPRLVPYKGKQGMIRVQPEVVQEYYQIGKRG